MQFDLQPQLQNSLIRIAPLKSEDFEPLYKVASDPLIWEQHPSKDRYKREVFENFFAEAMQSGGAFLVFNNQTGEIIGSSRYYEFNADTNSVAIGYTFIARAAWGTNYNRALKTLMLDHAFRFVKEVIFHIGIDNIRSQKAIEKLGAEKLEQQQKKYYGENLVTNLIYRITQENWGKNQTTNSGLNQSFNIH